MRTHLSVVGLDVTWVLFRKHFIVSINGDIFPVFNSLMVRVLSLKLRSLIHLELKFVYVKRQFSNPFYM